MKALCDTIMVGTGLHTFVQIHRMYHTKSEPPLADYGLQAAVHGGAAWGGRADCVLWGLRMWWGGCVCCGAMYVVGGYMGNLCTPPSILL